jgi:hypothetical protein
MQSVGLESLNKLDRDLKKIMDDIPQARREMHTRIADAVKNEVDFQIIYSGIVDSHGYVTGWQETHVGSGGGYAAVRASDSSTGEDSPGAITNYLENGHAIRGPSVYAKRKRKSRAKMAYKDGYHFYQNARKNAESIAIREAEDYVEEVARKLEG